MGRTAAINALLISSTIASGCGQIFGLDVPQHAAGDSGTGDISNLGDGQLDTSSSSDAGMFSCGSSLSQSLCMPFNGDTQDLSIHNNDAAATNVSFIAGHDGLALSFSPSSTVTIQDNTSFDLGQLTIRFWIRPTALPASATRYGILDAASRYRMFINAGGVVRCTVNAGPDLITTAALVVNTWTRVACTYDETTMKIYFNGALVASLIQAAIIPSANGTVTIGHNNPTGDVLVGALDSLELIDGIAP